MNIQISKIKLEEKEILISFLIQYLKELNEDTDYPFLDSYWEDDKRFPLKLTLGEKWAGFALINDYTMIESNTIAMAEFYILPAYRSLGYGHSFANKIIENYPGQWEISVLLCNINGLHFWESIFPNASQIIKEDKAVLSIP